MSFGFADLPGVDELYDLDLTPPAVPSDVAFIAAAGDTADKVGYPSTSPDVVSVGGTILTVDDSGNYEGESPYNDVGAGASWEAQPPYQNDIGEGTNNIPSGYIPDTTCRVTPDVAYAYAGSISNGYYAVFGTLESATKPSWISGVAGTSLGAPQWAALIALADEGRASHGLDAFTSNGAAGVQSVQEALYSAPADDFNLNGKSAVAGDQAYQGYTFGTGLGTPIADLLVNYLSNWSPKAVVAGSPAAITAGSPFSVTVDIEDQNGNILTNDNSEVTVSLAPDPTLYGPTTLQAVNGVAVFSDLFLDTSGSFSFVATDVADGLSTSSPSAPIAVSPAAATQLAFIQQPTNTTAGNVITPAVTVAVEDQFGNVVTSDNSYVKLRVIGPSSGGSDGNDVWGRAAAAEWQPVPGLFARGDCDNGRGREYRVRRRMAWPHSATSRWIRPELTCWKPLIASSRRQHRANSPFRRVRQLQCVLFRIHGWTIPTRRLASRWRSSTNTATSQPTTTPP